METAESPQAPTGSSEDRVLVLRARAGDPAAFEGLMRRHNTGVYRVVRAVMRDEAEVEDVMQAAYLHALKHLQELQGAQLFGPWLRRIAFHEALGRLRREKSGPFSEVDMDTLEPASPLADPERAATRVELKHAIERAVDALPDAFREVFMLRAVDGRSVAETAELLGVHEETVKTRHHRARARLKATLGEWVDLEVPEAFPFPATRCDRVVAAVLARLELVEGDG